VRALAPLALVAAIEHVGHRDGLVGRLGQVASLVWIEECLRRLAMTCTATPSAASAVA
jgi:hypothetical protein